MLWQSWSMIIFHNGDPAPSRKTLKTQNFMSPALTSVLNDSNFGSYLKYFQNPRFFNNKGGKEAPDNNHFLAGSHDHIKKAAKIMLHLVHYTKKPKGGFIFPPERH